MKKFQFNNRLMGLVVLACAVLAFSSVSFAETKVNESGKASASGLVMVENIAGSIKIIGWDKNEVKVEGFLSDEVKGLDFKATGKKTIIEVKYPRNMRSVDEGADLIIYAPVNSVFEVESISCRITIEKVTGSVAVEAISGDITLNGDCDEVELSCISGDITVEGDTKSLALESISGGVTAKGSRSTVRAESITGTIDLTFDTFIKLNVESVDSRVMVEGDLAAGGKMELESVSGDIILVIPEDISAEFNIESFSGSIGKAFGHKADKVSKYAPGSEMEFVTGGGDGRVDVSTFSGDVKIRH
jgi:DUF4097 and DUF4098 domain-containing protein YvlB